MSSGSKAVGTYYDLALPAETERFVYKIVAVKVILSNPERYGIFIDPQEYYRPPEVDSRHRARQWLVDCISAASRRRRAPIMRCSNS